MQHRAQHDFFPLNPHMDLIFKKVTWRSNKKPPNEENQIGFTGEFCHALKGE